MSGESGRGGPGAIPRRVALAGLTLALALPAAPAHAQDDAPTVLEPQRSMAGVRLQMTREEVRAVLGAPTETRTAHDPFGRTTTLYFSRPKLHVTFRSGERGQQVTSLFTRHGVVRTAGRVGVGSSERTVRRGVPGVRCQTFRLPGPDSRSCFVGRFSAGRTVTDFHLDSRRRVARIVLGVVID